jgi:ArsR family transcriptional regulator, lead/cadmium/zinc/bismuth-responsive transcriptional repressor
MSSDRPDHFPAVADACEASVCRGAYNGSVESAEVLRYSGAAPIDPEALAEGRQGVPLDDIVDQVVQAFQTLADPTRARILYALVRRSLCVRDLAILVGVSESAVSHQLRLLRDRRLVKPRRQGNVIYYTVEGHHVAALFREAEYHADHLRQGLPDHPYT